jgi:arabinofuranosyltransferase
VSIDEVRYFTIFDDGMISMRHAKNFVEHKGLVWNLGERVEGFTNPVFSWRWANIGRLRWQPISS